MKIELLSENLEHVLPLVGKTIPTTSQLPVLSSVLLTAQGNTFTLEATDLEFGVKISIPAKIIEEGAVAVPGKQLIEVLGTFPKDKITIEQKEGALSIIGRNNNVSFQTLPREEFPNLFNEKGEKLLSFSAQDLKSIFSKLMFSASIDESRPHLTGIFFSPKDDGTEIVSTDGFRLSLKRSKLKYERAGEFDLIVPVRLISEAINIKDDGLIDVYLQENTKQLIIESKNTTLVGRLIEGTYPPYSRVIPVSTKTTLEVSKEDLAQAMRTVGIFARDNANVVQMVIQKGKMTLKATASEIGEGEVVIDAKQDGEDMEISFNIKFILDFLKVVDGDIITITLNSGTEPAVFRVPQDPEFLHVIMPIKVQE